MGRALDDAALRIWIELVKLGGYWKLREFRAQSAIDMTGREMRERMNALEWNGMVRRRTADIEHPAWGVTTKCKAPPGYEHLLTGEPA